VSTAEEVPEPQSPKVRPLPNSESTEPPFECEGRRSFRRADDVAQAMETLSRDTFVIIPFIYQYNAIPVFRAVSRRGLSFGSIGLNAIPIAPRRFTDTLKRQVTVGRSYPTTITYPDSSGTSQTITLTYTPITLAPTFNPVAGSNINPSPVNRNNPRNDPDVQRGFDQHQREHGR